MTDPALFRQGPGFLGGQAGRRRPAATGVGPTRFVLMVEDTGVMNDIAQDEPALTGQVLAPPPGTLSAADRQELLEAVRRLQNSRGLVIRGADLLAGLLGSAASFGWRGLKLSPAVTGKLRGIAEVALRRAFDVAVLGVETGGWVATPRQGRIIAAASGAVGGFLGMAGFLPDATLTTLLVMRSIATIAREEGEDMGDAGARQACLEVFAFGSPSLDAAEEGDAGYWSARMLMHGRPLMMLFSEVAGRYGLRISEKLAVQAVPIVGAASGALVNTVFLDHYRNLARVHFTIRRLERRYGTGDVRATAQQMAQDMRLAA